MLVTCRVENCLVRGKVAVAVWRGRENLKQTPESCETLMASHNDESSEGLSLTAVF